MLTLDVSAVGNAEGALEREWLVPNGLGGYAALSVAGTATRAYHGLLVGALGLGGDRLVTVAQLDAWAESSGSRYRLATPEYGGSVPDTAALASFMLDGTMPVTRWQAGSALIEQRVWAEPGKNTTLVEYRVVQGSARLHIAPLLTLRSPHGRTHGYAHWHFHRWNVPGGVALEAFPDAPPVLLLSEPETPLGGNASWYWQVQFRHEARRGYPATEDLYCPGAWDVDLTAGQPFVLAFSLEPSDSVDRDAEASRARVVLHADDVLARSGRSLEYDPFARQLLLAADTFIVQGPSGPEVLAGYPWLGAATRDALIALPGLCLSAGRHGEAAAILRALSERFRDGLLPDALSGWGSDSYTNADAGLWWFAVLDAYVTRTGDLGLLREVFSAAEGAFRALAGVEGRRGRLHMDRDGLLTLSPDSGLHTWMNAYVHGTQATPRAGKPVEINALWYHAVVALARWGERGGRPTQGLPQLAGRIREAFNNRFWFPDGDFLYDVVDGPGGVDASLRPNQLLAVSLPDAVLTAERHRAVLEQVTAHLTTRFGLRTLSPFDPRYRSAYEGDTTWRDGAAHQGSVWPWLIGPYVDAALRVEMDPLRLRALFTGFQSDLARGAVGTLGEVYDGAPPHNGGGAPSYSASVAEVLRAWLRLQDTGSR